MCKQIMKKGYRKKCKIEWHCRMLYEYPRTFKGTLTPHVVLGLVLSA